MPKHGLFLILLAFISSIAFPAMAADHYIRPAGSTYGSGNGQDWGNACSGFAGACAVGSMVRGDTYYVAAGTYAGPTFSRAVSGTLLITIKKATVADHGTSAGWSDALGGGAATLTGGVRFSTSYWVLDGQTGGGPGSWTSGFGFVITQTSATPIVELVLNSRAGNITVRHVELSGNRNSNGGGSIAQDAFALKSSGANFTVSYYYTHGVGRCPFFCGSTGNPCPGLVAEYGYIGDFVSTSAQHSEVASISQMGGDVDFRYNVITAITGTGGLMWDNSANHNAQLRIYGNVFYKGPGAQWDNNANGIIGSWTSGDGFNIKVYNNTFINVTGARIFTDFISSGAYGGNEAWNNLFYNSISPSYANFQSHDYNYYINSGGTHGEAHAQTTPTADPFANIAALDFSVVAATNSGLMLPSPLTTDPVGNTRGADGVWDRGAYEFSASRPAPPTDLRIDVIQ